MIEKEEFEAMVSDYGTFVIEPIVKKVLNWDSYDNVKIVHFFDNITGEVVYRAIRERPDYYMIDKMYCEITKTHIFEIMDWCKKAKALADRLKKEGWHKA